MDEKDLLFDLLDTAARLTARLDGSLSTIKGISFSEYQILKALRDHPSSAASRVDLAGAVGLSPSGVTRALKPMEKLGLVETMRDGRDARKSLAALTKAGAELVADADGVVGDVVEQMTFLRDLGDDDRRLLSRFLEGLHHG